MNGVDSSRNTIQKGRAVLGLELGSTRIKAVLIDASGAVLAKGDYEWENHFIDGIWTYDKEEIWQGIRSCYASLACSVREKYGISIKTLAGIGISGMMHGYLPFDAQGALLVPFRTWRNNITGEASNKLTELFHYNIPQRFSIAHLYQAILNQEAHVEKLAYMTTLAGYIHWKLTGKKVLGIGEASGMFPIDVEEKDYDRKMISQFDSLYEVADYPWNLEEILPKVLMAGETAGVLTKEGAALLDESGKLKEGIPFCPPEGDAGTGMVATNSVAVKTGNVSAGTSAFAMVVMEKQMHTVHKELDLVTTPTGNLVAMAHANNCTSDINAWTNVLNECLEAFGLTVDKEALFETLFKKSEQGDMDGGGLLSYGFYSGEHGVGLTEGCPMVLHPADASFTLANFMKVQLYTCFGAMKLGMDILTKEENVRVDKIVAQGGIFKTKGVAQKVLSAALDVPVAVMETAGEGGPWGMAVLASYMANNKEGQSLEEYLEDHIFASVKNDIVMADKEMVKGYETFITRYKEGLRIERTAVEQLRKQEAKGECRVC